MFKRFIILFFILSIVTACAPAGDDREPGLVAEATFTARPDVNRVDNTTAIAIATSDVPVEVVDENPNPLQRVTFEADSVLVTPTLPPSKTPSETPTQTLTPTQTMTPTITVTASATTFLLPTSEIIAITQAVPQPINQVCDSTWFFIEPRPASCPLNPPNVGQGVYQSFQNGYMVWVGNQDAIYVMYNDQQFPRWQVFRDYFNEGMPEVAGDYLNAPGPGLWQPRRGFGLLWRDNRVVRDRIGWGTMEWEQPFSTQVQTSNEGEIFISRPDTGVFILLAGGRDWRTAATRGGGLPTMPRTSDGFVPLPTVIGN